MIYPASPMSQTHTHCSFTVDIHYLILFGCASGFLRDAFTDFPWQILFPSRPSYHSCKPPQ